MTTTSPWRNRLARHRPLFAVLGRARPADLVVLCALYGIRAFAPVLAALLVGRYAGAVLDVPPGAIGVAVLLLAGLGAALAAEHAAACFVEPAELRAARRIEGAVRDELCGLVLAVEPVRLEEPPVRDRIALVLDRSAMYAIGRGAVGQLWLATRFAAAFAAAGVMAGYSPVAAGLLLVCMIVLRSLLRRQWSGITDAVLSTQDGHRRARYLGDLLGRGTASHELAVAGSHRWFTDRFAAQAGANAEALHRARIPVLRRQPLIALLTVLGVAVVVLALPHPLGGGTPDAAAVATFLQAAWAVLAIGSAGSEGLHVEHALPPLHALHRLRAELPPRTCPDAPAGRPAPRLIELREVRFRYPGTEADVLRGVDLTVEPGESLAIVGTNGAGKSTLLKVLCGLVEPSSGRASAGGAPLVGDEAARWWRELALVTQRPNAFPLSLRDNVLVGTGAPTGTDPAEVLRTVGLAQVVADLPAGADAVLGDQLRGGVELSAGQRQRIAIARALLRVRHTAAVLVLDEPTANLDSAAEERIIRHLRDRLAGTTRIVVSHRLANLRACDRIAVLHDGVIAEIGTHDELMRRGGHYAAMFTAQAAAFREPDAVERGPAQAPAHTAARATPDVEEPPR